MRLFLFPLLGFLGLAWASWASLRESPRDPHRPPLEWRLGAGFLGALGGRVMASLGYAPDAAHRVVGLPMPVCQLVNQAGTWTDVTSPLFLPCLLLDLLIGAALAYRLLRILWPRLQPAPARRR